MNLSPDSLNTQMALGADFPSEQDFQEPAQTPTILERLSSTFSNMFDQLGDIMPKPRTREFATGIAVGTLALTGGLASAAAAKKPDIVVGKGIDGVDTGDTPLQVTKAVGAPTRKEPPAQGETVWTYPTPLEFSVAFRGGHVIGTTTYNPEDKTNKGIGVGSSLSALKKAYPVKCTPGSGPGGSPQSETCTIKSGHGKSERVTIFEFTTKAAGIEEVDIGLPA